MTDEWGWEAIDAEDVLEALGAWWVPESCRDHVWVVQHHAAGSRYRCRTCDNATDALGETDRG